jgi:hypothetical protein
VDEDRGHDLMGSGMTAVKDNISCPHGFLPFGFIHGETFFQTAGTGLDMPAEFAVAHLFAPAHAGAVRAEKSDPGIDKGGEIIQQRLYFIAEDQFKSRFVFSVSGHFISMMSVAAFIKIHLKALFFNPALK